MGIVKSSGKLSIRAKSLIVGIALLSSLCLFFLTCAGLAKSGSNALSVAYEREMIPQTALFEAIMAIEEARHKSYLLFLGRGGGGNAASDIRAESERFLSSWRRYKTLGVHKEMGASLLKTVGEIDGQVQGYELFLESLASAIDAGDNAFVSDAATAGWPKIKTTLSLPLKGLLSAQTNDVRLEHEKWMGMAMWSYVFCFVLLVFSVSICGYFLMSLYNSFQGAMASVAMTLNLATGRKAEENRPEANDDDELMELASAVRAAVTEMAEERVQIEEAFAKNEAILNAVSDPVIGSSEDGTCLFVNDGFSRVFGFTKAEAVGRPSWEMISRDGADMFVRRFETPSHQEILMTRRDGTGFLAEVGFSCMPVGHGSNGIVAQIHDVSGRRINEQIMKESISELTDYSKNLENAQQQLIQAEKMVSIGNLAAGIAHEINNPIGFVAANFEEIRKLAPKILAVVEAAEAFFKNGAKAGEDCERMRLSLDALEPEWLKEDLPNLVSETADGLARVKTIVQNLKDFARTDAAESFQFAELSKALSSTITIATNEIKYVADVRTELIPIEVECIPGQLNQVFLNLLVNAAHAIGADGARGRGTIGVRLRRGVMQDGRECAEVSISDTGCGISKENMSRIFNPFFTTKPPGKGTGLGLSIAYSIIMKHDGALEVASEEGVGTTFTIKIPFDKKPRK